MCNHLLSSITNNKKLQWLKKLPDEYYFYTTVTFFVLFLIFINFISLIDGVWKKIFVLLFMILFSMISFFYGTGALMNTPQNIKNKFLCLLSLIQIFGFLPIAIIMFINMVVR